METLFLYLMPVAMGAVTVALLMGLWTMLKGDNPNLSQRLMRWRVGLQFVAICVIMVTIYLTHS